MSLHALVLVNNLLIKRVPVCPDNLNHDRFHHFVAGNDTSHTSSSIHFLLLLSRNFTFSQKCFDAGDLTASLLQTTGIRQLPSDNLEPEVHGFLSGVRQLRSDLFCR
jgi:hypothetical protein